MVTEVTVLTPVGLVAFQPLRRRAGVTLVTAERFKS